MPGAPAVPQRPIIALGVVWIKQPGCRTLIDEIYGPDQIVEVTHTYHLLKGANHEADGTGGTGEMQAYVTIQNRDPNNAATFNVMMGEVF